MTTPSHSALPDTAWPPARTETSSPCSCANASAAATSAALSQRATYRGRVAIMALNSVHASS